MSHNHHHAHSNNGEYGNKFKIGILLNIAFVIIEFIFGIIYNSLALIADAGHNLTDVAGLMIAWFAFYLTKKKPSKNFTYGLKKSPIIGAQLNSLLLLVAIGVIIWEAVGRLYSPPEVKGSILIFVASVGIVINGITTMLFHSGKDSDLNIKGAYLHMLADTLISLGVVLSGILILFINASWIDSVISIVIAVLIFWSTWKLLQDATILSLDGVPSSIDLNEIKEYLKNVPEINCFHDLHVWALSTTENALTVHVTMHKNIDSDDLINKMNEDFAEKFNISHTTIQIENRECNNSC